MRKIFLFAVVPALIASGWVSAFAQGAVVAAAAVAARAVPIAPVPMSAVQMPMSLTQTALGAPLMQPSLSRGLPTVNAALSPTLTSGLGTRSVLPAVRSKALGASRNTALTSALPAFPGQRVLAGKQALSLNKGKTAHPALAGVSKTARSVMPALGSTRLQGSISARLGRMFDGIGKLPGLKSLVPQMAFRPPSWSEDRRINKAIERLHDSSIGTDIYAYVYENHDDLRIMVDDDRDADYDARLTRKHGKPVLYLTENLVDNESLEVVSAYMVREMSHLYLESFPESVERSFLAYSNMARTFAELTESGKSRYGYWWDKGRDQWTGDDYAMKRYYASWKEAIYEYAYGSDYVPDTPFFKYLREIGREMNDTSYGMSLRQLYRNGDLSYSEYKEMRDYFRGFNSSESEWLSDTGRW